MLIEAMQLNYLPDCIKIAPCNDTRTVPFIKGMQVLSCTSLKLYHIGLDKPKNKKNERENVDIFLSLSFNICFWCSKEPSH